MKEKKQNNQEKVKKATPKQKTDKYIEEMVKKLENQADSIKTLHDENKKLREQIPIEILDYKEMYRVKTQEVDILQAQIEDYKKKMKLNTILFDWTIQNSIILFNTLEIILETEQKKHFKDLLIIKFIKDTKKQAIENQKEILKKHNELKYWKETTQTNKLFEILELITKIKKDLWMK